MVVDLSAWNVSEHDVGVEFVAARNRGPCGRHPACGFSHRRLVARQHRGVAAGGRRRVLLADAEQLFTEPFQQTGRNLGKLCHHLERQRRGRCLRAVGDHCLQCRDVRAFHLGQRRLEGEQTANDDGHFPRGRSQGSHIRPLVKRASGFTDRGPWGLDRSIRGALDASLRVLELGHASSWGSVKKTTRRSPDTSPVRGGYSDVGSSSPTLT